MTSCWLDYTVTADRSRWLHRCAAMSEREQIDRAWRVGLCACRDFEQARAEATPPGSSSLDQQSQLT